MEVVQAVFWVFGQALVVKLGEGAVEQAEIAVEGVYQLQENARVLLLEERLLGVVLLIGYCLLLLFDRLLGAEDVLGVLQHDVEPDILLDLLDDMSELLRADALDGVVVLGEGLEEGDDTFADAGLLPPLVDVDGCGVEEEDLGVSELLLCRLLRLGLEGRVDGEDGADLQL